MLSRESIYKSVQFLCFGIVRTKAVVVVMRSSFPSHSQLLVIRSTVLVARIYVRITKSLEDHVRLHQFRLDVR